MAIPDKYPATHQAFNKGNYIAFRIEEEEVCPGRNNLERKIQEAPAEAFTFAPDAFTRDGQLFIPQKCLYR